MGERYLEDCVTCMSHHVYRLLCGVLPGVDTLFFSPLASDQKQDIGAGAGDRRV